MLVLNIFLITIFFAIILFLMCIPGFFLKKPEGEEQDFIVDKEKVKSDNVIKVLKTKPANYSRFFLYFRISIN